MSKTYETLRIEYVDKIAEVTLIRPEINNRFDAIGHLEMALAFEELKDNRDIRAICFTAQGKHFSAGGDMAYMLKNADPHHRREGELEARRLFEAATSIPVPIVVGMQGDAIGLGATVVLCCDAVVASKNARIADPHVLIGLAAGDGGCVLWPSAMGILRAKRYLLTGDRLTATDAHAMGLVTDLVDEPADVLPAARALATRIAGLPPLAVQGTKRALNKVVRARAQEVFDFALHFEMDTFATDDLKEAVDAFKERRPAAYKGR